ncbi:MAG: 2,3-diaminopropionate biosynthesis protein SbnA [Cytophagales bacterium]|nr:2,3-diaminopropionate biosynthesis protein SbnA [Cytophagales bacterium]
MVQYLDAVRPLIGNTPMKRVKNNLLLKLEYFSYTGSMKDRAAFSIISNAIRSGQVNSSTCIIESSSGNFAVALATICRDLELKFIAVIDPNITDTYEQMLQLLCHRVEKVTKIDSTGGYLLTRINTVKELCAKIDNSYWPNQYDNPNNYLGYYNGLSDEIIRQVPRLDYLFVAVSSGGTIIGLSMRLKEHFPNIKVIAVDVKGSVVFGDKPAKRYVSGIGSSKVPSLIDKAHIDRVMLVSQPDIINGCQILLHEYNVFGGASSGAICYAIDEFMKESSVNREAVKLAIIPDKGTAYMNSIYNKEWVRDLNEKVGGVMEYANEK